MVPELKTWLEIAKYFIFFASRFSADKKGQKMDGFSVEDLCKKPTMLKYDHIIADISIFV